MAKLTYLLAGLVVVLAIALILVLISVSQSPSQSPSTSTQSCPGMAPIIGTYTLSWGNELVYPITIPNNCMGYVEVKAYASSGGNVVIKVYQATYGSESLIAQSSCEQYAYLELNTLQPGLYKVYIEPCGLSLPQFTVSIEINVGLSPTG